LHHRKEGWPSD